MAKYPGVGFRMIGNVHYVGTAAVSSHLLSTPEGHILIDACFPKDGPAIVQNILGLGFKPRDVKYVLLTHAHIDHIGAAAFLAKETGAQMCIGTADRKAAEEGSPTMLELAGTEPFKIDHVIREGDVIRLGGMDVRVYDTPGHTPGCCSFGFPVTEGGKTHSVFLFGGPGTNVFMSAQLKRNIYGGTREDFARTLDRLDALSVDVWLGAHPNQNKTFDKYEQLQKGAHPNPFIDPDGWKAYLQGRRETLRNVV